MQSVSCNALNFGSPNNNYKFNGGDEWEESLNLYSTFFRGYDQQIGRFRGVDMLSEKTGGISSYQFSLNNPVSFNDPLGNTAATPDHEEAKKNAGREEAYWNAVYADAIAAWLRGSYMSGASFSELLGDAEDDNAEILDGAGGLVVTGSQAAKDKFAQVVSEGTGGVYNALIGEDGQVSLDRQTKGQMTEEQQAFFDDLEEATDMSKPAVTINIVDHDDLISKVVFIGSYPLKAIDIDDVIALKNSKSLTPASAIGHEIAENVDRKRGTAKYSLNHNVGLIAGDKIAGNHRIDTDQPYVSHTTENYVNIPGYGNQKTLSGWNAWRFDKGAKRFTVIIYFDEFNITSTDEY